MGSVRRYEWVPAGGAPREAVLGGDDFGSTKARCTVMPINNHVVCEKFL